MDSLQGQLLWATGDLQDPNFSRTVVLIIQHGEDGALGVVLNRPTGQSVKDLWEQIGESPCVTDATMNVGGPIQGPVMALHECAESSEIDVIPGVYFSTEKEHLERIVASEDHRSRLFMGYSGWAPGQLESELETGSWKLLPASHIDVFSDQYTLWKRTANSLTKDLFRETLNLRVEPGQEDTN